MGKALKEFTGHVPVEVVKQPVTIAVWVTQIDEETDSGRPLGRASTGVTIGGRENPVFTPDEIEYISGVLRWAIDYISNPPDPVEGFPPLGEMKDERREPWPSEAA